VSLLNHAQRQDCHGGPYSHSGSDKVVDKGSPYAEVGNGVAGECDGICADSVGQQQPGQPNVGEGAQVDDGAEESPPHRHRRNQNGPARSLNWVRGSPGLHENLRGSWDHCTQHPNLEK